MPSHIRTKSLWFTLVAFITLGCGCSFSELTDKIAKSLVNNATKKLPTAQAGPFRWDDTGMAFEIPEGFTGSKMLIDGWTVTPVGEKYDPMFTIERQPLNDETDFESWKDRFSQSTLDLSDTENIPKSIINISGMDGYRTEYTFSNMSQMNGRDIYQDTRVRIILDGSPEWVIIISGMWPSTEDESIRPIFDAWLESIEIYDPIETTTVPGS